MGLLGRLRRRRWTPVERAILISVIAIVMGALFVTSYSLALGDPVAHHIDAAVIGDPGAHPATVDAVDGVADGSLDLRPYASLQAALHAIDEQDVYAALDLTSERPTLYVASAAGASVARVLERISAVDPTVKVVDTHPLDPHDPSGVDIFYLMLVATIIGFLGVFQVRANAGGLSQRQWIVFVLFEAVVAALVFALVDGPLLNRVDLPVLEAWGDPRAADPRRRVVRVHDGRVDRPVGNPSHPAVLRRFRQQLVWRRRGTAIAPTAVRVPVAMAPVGSDCDGAP